MWPEAAAEALALQQRQRNPALTVGFQLGPDGSVSRTEIVTSRLPPISRLEHHTVEKILRRDTNRMSVRVAPRVEADIFALRATARKLAAHYKLKEVSHLSPVDIQNVFLRTAG
jgi:exoribonuclease R